MPTITTDSHGPAANGQLKPAIRIADGAADHAPDAREVAFEAVESDHPYENFPSFRQSISSPASSQTAEGGYGWVVVGAAFLCSFVVDGVANAFCMYLIEFKDLFTEPEAVTSWIGSLLVGVYLFMGPIACGLADSFGYRIIIASGSLIAALGFILSYFVTNVYVLFLTFGVIGGTGFGLIYSPSIMCVCAYFKERSALAVGISVCGSSVGGMVFPNFVQLLLDKYGWQGSMLFLAGTSLQCLIAASLMRNPRNKNVPGSPKRKSCMPSLLKQVFNDVTSLGVYKIPAFVVYSCASFVGSIAFLTPSFFLPSFAIRKFTDLDRDTAATVITAICGAGIFGRIFWGALADRPRMDPLMIHNLCILTSGISLILVPVCQSFTGLLVDGVIFGFFIAPYISLMSTILSSRIGLEQLPSAFGQTQLIAGLASVVGPPLHGNLEGITNPAMPFFIAGAAWITASAIASLIFFLPKRSPLPEAEKQLASQGSDGQNSSYTTGAVI